MDISGLRWVLRGAVLLGCRIDRLERFTPLVVARGAAPPIVGSFMAN
jgi:hypothetical protein